jgi:hypothetical protein
MKKLGITYQHSTPQSIGDQWWFWNCENIPDPLPKHLSILKEDPMKCIGWGLSEEDAKKIRDYNNIIPSNNYITDEMIEKWAAGEVNNIDPDENGYGDCLIIGAKAIRDGKIKGNSN